MNKYTIYCTQEQTRKALELGAPIITTSKDASMFFCAAHPKTFISKGVKKSNNEFTCAIPTAEQMIYWLESLGGIEEITVCKTGMWIWGENHTLIDGSPNYSSRKESTLAAIDAALEYLTSKK